MRMLDLKGSKFNALTVLSFAGKKGGKTTWNCECICGSVSVVSTSNLRSGHTKSCGCARYKDAASDSYLYRTYHDMIQRCENSSNHRYPDYGGRGISVCRSWRTDVRNFYRDVGQRPSPRHSLDRKDNSKGYSPDNVRWATQAEQSQNKRDTVLSKEKVMFSRQLRYLAAMRMRDVRELVCPEVNRHTFAAAVTGRSWKNVPMPPKDPQDK